MLHWGTRDRTGLGAMSGRKKSLDPAARALDIIEAAHVIQLSQKSWPLSTGTFDGEPPEGREALFGGVAPESAPTSSMSSQADDALTQEELLYGF